MTDVKRMRRGYHDLCRREILELVPAFATRILDLGCGTGALGKALKQRQKCVVDGIELNKEASTIAKESLDHTWSDNLNRFDPSYLSGKYDCLVFADILEHLVNPWQVLKTFASVLTDDGVVIASIPNIAHPVILSQLSKGLFRYELAGILDATHLRFFTKTSIFQMFYKAGLKIIDIQPSPSAENPTQYLVTAVKQVLVHPDPLVTILLLTWNAWEYTRQCIDSIKARTDVPSKIIVIDNGSTDETIRRLRTDPTICHIENSCNLGFGRGFNVGLELIDTPYFVISNNDVVVTPGWLTRMIGHIDMDKDLVCLGPVSNHVSGPQLVRQCQYNSENSLIDFAQSIAEKTEDAVTYFQRVVFFCTLFKSRVLQKCGLLDERFEHGNFEDDDYCMRIKRAGLKSAIDRSVFIHHYQGKTFTHNKLDYAKILEENKQKFMQKWNLTDINEYFHKCSE